MATFTAATLIAAGLRRAGMVDSATGFIVHSASSSQAHDILNAAISALYEILYEGDAESYASTKATFNTVQGQADYALSTVAGTTFYHLRGVDWFDGVRWHDLERVNFGDRNRYAGQGTPSGYSLEGDNLTIYPDPGGVYSMRLYYVPNPPVMVADSDTVDLKGPWREYVEKHFAAQCLDIEESDTLALWAYVKELEQRIRAASKKRDNGSPSKPLDVQGDWDPWNPFGSMSRGF